MRRWLSQLLSRGKNLQRIVTGDHQTIPFHGRPLIREGDAGQIDPSHSHGSIMLDFIQDFREGRPNRRVIKKLYCTVRTIGWHLPGATDAKPPSLKNSQD